MGHAGGRVGGDELGFVADGDSSCLSPLVLGCAVEAEVGLFADLLVADKERRFLGLHGGLVADGGSELADDTSRSELVGFLPLIDSADRRSSFACCRSSARRRALTALQHRTAWQSELAE